MNTRFHRITRSTRKGWSNKLDAQTFKKKTRHTGNIIAEVLVSEVQKNKAMKIVRESER